MAKNARAKLLGERVAERLRLLKKETQESMARAVGMTQQGIQMILSGASERPRKLREIARFLNTSQEYLLGETDDHRPAGNQKAGSGIELPILSIVSAGRLADVAEPLPVDDLPSILVGGLGGGDFFGLRVEGDSMDRLSPEGSVVIVNRRERTLIDGRPYIFAVRGEATYKLWHRKPQYLAPFSTNPRNEPIFIERKRELEVVGRVRRTILDL